MRYRIVAIAIVLGLCACAGGGPKTGAGSGQADTPNAQALIGAAADTDDWVLPGKTYSFNRYVNAAVITPQNVTSLRKAWVTPLLDDGEQESSPIVWHGTVYIATPHDNVLALDAASGKVKWAFSYAPQYVLAYAVNRGVGLADGRVYLGTQDCHVIALDAATGKVDWNVLGCEGTSGYSSTENSWFSIAAYPYNGAVYLSTAGGDQGNIGLLTAFDERTGKRLWSWHTVPEPGEPHFGTWPGNSWQHGGAAIWAGMSFEPSTNTLYATPGNAGPNLTLYGRKGQDLYSDSLVALQLGSGTPKLRWYYQLLQNDTHDADPAMPPVLFDGTVGGTPRKLVATADKDGNFAIVDRTNGKLVHRLSVSMQKAILALPTTQGTYSCPNHGGGVEWNGGSYDPKTNYFIVPSTQECALWKVVSTGPVQYIAGQPYTAGPLPKRRNATGVITAIDVSTGKVAWHRPFPYPAQGGVTITSTGIAFTSDGSGRIYALDTKTGNELWHDDTGSTIVDSLSLYRINGTPYLVTIAGEGGNQKTPNLPKTKGSQVVAYALNASSTQTNTTDGQPTPAPMPSSKTESGQTAGTGASAPYTLAQASTGKALFQKNCASCHGATLQGISAPALTGASFAHANLSVSQVRTVVTTQMPLNAPGSLSPSQYAAIMAYLLEYDCVSPSGAGKTPFPAAGAPALTKVKMPGATCPVK